MSNPDLLGAGDPASLDRAAAALKRGELVAVPTETVYGLAADATDSAAVARIYEAKARPRFNPLIAHVDSLARAEDLVRLSPLARRLAEAFWPGPLTIVAPLRAEAGISDLVTAGLDTLAVRWPDAPAMTGLVSRLDRPLAAPSANRSGKVSPTTAAHVAEELSQSLSLILDDGPCRVGLESTIVAVDGERAVLLRPGGIARADIEAVTGSLDAPDAIPGAPTSPGQLSSHYAPTARLRLKALKPHSDEAFIAFGPDEPGPGEAAAVINLSKSGDLAEAAARLFSALRTLDAEHDKIAVAPIPDTGLGEAINDRLHRAAAPRTA